MKIAVLDDYARAFSSLPAARLLAGHEVVTLHEAGLPLSELAARLAGVEALVLTQQRSPISRELLEQVHSLRYLAQTGRSASHIDLSACTQQGVLVVLAGQGSPHATAELTWALLLASRRHLVREANALREGRWQSSLGEGLFGKRLGIYAFGRIGACVARIGRAFGMRVWCWGRDASLQRARAENFEVAPSREDFFAGSEVVSLHLPLSPETRGLIRPEDLAQMSPRSLLVNTSRAQLLGPGTLVRALQAGRPGFAAVDVYEEEPVLEGNHPLLSLPNALCTPHLGFTERETLNGYYEATLQAFLRLIGGESTLALNPEALSVPRP
jgi:D-3-phosphoglycerate dehydrogenase